MACDVCYGTPGRYPIIDRYGAQLYEIACPECAGTGLNEAEFDFEQQHKADRAKYEAAMAEMRATPVSR